MAVVWTLSLVVIVSGYFTKELRATMSPRPYTTHTHSRAWWLAREPAEPSDLPEAHLASYIILAYFP